MVSQHENKKYTREKGKKALETVLKQQKNIQIIEQYINKQTEKKIYN